MKNCYGCLNKKGYRRRDNMFKVFVIMLITSVLIVSCGSSRNAGSYNSTTVSYYADRFSGKKTASGEIYRHHRMTASHKTLPFGTKVEIVNTSNNKKVHVTVNDRGTLKPSRAFDLSQGAFKKIADLRDGVVKVRYRVLN